MNFCGDGSRPRPGEREPERPTRWDRAVLWLLAAAIPLINWRLLPSVSAADVCLGLAAGAWAWRTDLRRLRPLSATCLTSVAALWLWALAGGAWRAFGSPLPFSEPEFVRSFAKFSFYLVAATVVIARLVQFDGREVRRVVAGVLAAHALVGVVLYGAKVIDPEVRETLPGTETRLADHYYHLRRFGDRSPESFESLVFPRARGLLREPAQLGILHGLGLAFLLLGPRRPPRLGRRHLLIVASVLLSFSLSGYALLAAVAVIAAWRWRRHRAAVLPPRPRLAEAALAAVVVALLIPPVAPTLHHAIGLRVAGLLSGRADGSTTARLETGLQAGRAIGAAAPMIGAGLGNFDIALEAQRSRLPRQYLLPRGSQGWNVLVYLLATTGWPGIFLFGVSLAALLRHRPQLAGVWILSLFAWVGFLTAPFWIFFSLYITTGSARPDAIPARVFRAGLFQPASPET